MNPIDRRTFLAGLAGSFVLVSAESLRGGALLAAPQYGAAPAKPAIGAASDACWLDVAAPFVVEDPSLELVTQILLTATCFPGVDGFRDSKYATEYQILLWDANGREIPLGNDGRLEIPSLRPTLVKMTDVAGRKAFWGGAKIRIAPSRNQVSRAGDLFSAGFVRWATPGNFDNVHAHPAAPQQALGHYNYSMPFPSLGEYHAAFALFNPNDTESAGAVRTVDRLGRTVVERPYKLNPHQTTLYTLADLKPAATPGEALAIAPLKEEKVRDGGVVVVHNDSDVVSFAYTLMKGRDVKSFTVEHPLHFSSDAPVKPARPTPYGPNRAFPASALLYTPLLFAGRRFGELQLESRFYLSASRWLEEALWMMPFVTTSDGMIAWVSNRDEKFPERVTPAAVTDQGLLRLTEFQSCRLDARGLPLPDAFSGGFGVATIPKTSHSLNKVEVRVTNWGRAAFTHFRPGGAVHKSYRKAENRGDVASDYIVSGCQVRGRGDNRKRDCLLALMNIEFEEEHTDAPTIQLFGPSGLLAEKKVGDFPPLACRHLLVSELFPQVESDPGTPLTVRMLAPNAMMIVSALHIDYERRDIALEHGSDRHSTFQDFKC